MVRIISCVVLVATLFCFEGFSQASKRANRVKDKNMFTTNICMPKGGLSIISNKDLYIVLKSTKNELMLGAEERWAGQDVPTPEVAIVFEGKVWSQQALPRGFDLSKAVVVSFERDKVRFLDFSEMSGGFYLRPGEN